MSLEKEYRYKVTKEIIEKILEISEVISEKQNQIDLTLGYQGFDSLANLGYVCRVRKKGKKVWLEVKNKINSETFEETIINIQSFKEGVKFFESIGMKPYLYMNRTRQILKFKGLTIFIDNIDLLGDYVEVEFHDSLNAEQELKEFLRLVGIEHRPQGLYGDIFREKMKEEEFKKRFDKILNNSIKEL